MSGDRDELLAIQRAYGIVRLVHVLPRRARPPPRVHRGERPHARARSRRAGRDRPVRSPRSRRDADRGGQAVPGPRRGRHQAPPSRPALPPRRPAARAGVRPRRGAPRPRAHPRRPGAAADRGLARAAPRPALPAGADHRPRGDRRPRRDGTELRRPARGLLRHVRLERPRPARPLPARPARAGRLRVRLPVRPPAELAPARRANGACGRAGRPPAPGDAPRHRRPDRGRARSGDTDRAAGRHGALASGHVPPDPPVPDDGVGDALDAASGGRRSASSASRSTPARSARTATATRPTRSASCSSRPATSGSWPRARRTTSWSGGAPSAAPSGSSISRACSR